MAWACLEGVRSRIEPSVECCPVESFEEGEATSRNRRETNPSRHSSICLHSTWPTPPPPAPFQVVYM